MLTNLLIVVFLGLMAYWWGLVQGWFGAWLHLMVVVVAGAMSFGLWEVVVVHGLMHVMPEMAWGVGLVGSFVAWVWVLRKVTQRLVWRPVAVNRFLDRVVGCGLGLLAGVLTSGLTLIGVGFLPLGADLGGYQPKIVDPTGRLVEHENGRLWLAVDEWAWWVWSGMSSGVFQGPGELARYQPQLVEQARLYRMRQDPNSSLAVEPGGVRVTGVVTSGDSMLGVDRGVLGRLKLGASLVGRRMVVVETRWKAGELGGTYDTDGVLRVAATQVRLITKRSGGQGRLERVQLRGPVGWTRAGENESQQVFRVFDSDRETAYSYAHEAVIGWVFVVRGEEELTDLVVRHMRFALPDGTHGDQEIFSTHLGRLDMEEAGTEGNFGGGVEKVAVVASDELPGLIHETQFGAIEVRERRVYSGNLDTVMVTPGPQGGTIARLWVDGQQAVVRVGFTREQAHALLGVSSSGTTGQGQVSLADDRGGKWLASGYVWTRSQQRCQIVIDRTQLVDRIDQLPVWRMDEGDKLYLYFLVRKGTRVVSLEAGRRSIGGLGVVAGK